MHELSIAQELYRACRDEVDRRGGGSIEEVTIHVGDLAGIEPDCLRFAWMAVVEDGQDAGAQLDIRWRPARQDCADCGEITARQPGTWLRLCPLCSGPLAVIGGRELTLRRLAFTSAEEEVPA